MFTPHAPLEDLQAVFTDCQATGASPRKGHLLELGWWVTGQDAVHAHFVALPDGEQIPPQVSRITGIRDYHLEHALPALETWRQFCAALPSQQGPVPVVAHFARYERAFLDDLGARFAAAGAPTLSFLCTHEIARRLEPNLPRRGLRALAGYHGYHLGEQKRAAPHVEATRVIWREQVARLADEGVRTLSDLEQWLTQKPGARSGPWTFPMPRKERLALPDRPGVYRMKGKGDELLYIGKATSLRRRVNSYFQKRRHTTRDTLDLLTQVFSIDHTVTASAAEAALLEADEIKRLAPPYNSALRERTPGATPWYVSQGLDAMSPCRDDVCALGPLPGEDHARQLLLLGRLLTLGLSPADNQRRLLGLPLEADSLPREILEAGTRLFRGRHGLAAGEPKPAARLLRLGASLVRAREAEPDPPDGKDDAPADRQWDDERVARHLEGACMTSARLLRRGRWLRDLSHCDVTWPPAGGHQLRRLILRAGKITHRATFAPGERAPALQDGAWPAGGDLDLATHDRLRVLSTEIRRLLGARRCPTIHLKGGTPLEPQSIARRLRWI